MFFLFEGMENSPQYEGFIMLGAREPESKHHATLRLLGSDAKHRFHLGTETKAYKESHLRGLCHLVGFGEDRDV